MVLVPEPPRRTRLSGSTPRLRAQAGPIGPGDAAIRLGAQFKQSSNERVEDSTLRFRAEMKLKNDRDQAGSLEALKDRDSKWRPILHAELLQRKGSNAIGVTQEGLEEYRKLGDAVDLPNDTQNRLFQAEWQRRHRFAADTLQRHEVRQSDIALKASRVGAVENESARIFAESSNDAVIDDGIQNIRAIAVTSAQEDGLDKEATEARVREVTSAPLRDVITKRSETDYLGAQEIRDAYQGDMTNADLKAVDDVIGSDTLMGEAQDISAVAHARGGTLEQRLDWIERQDFRPELQKQARDDTIHRDKVARHSLQQEEVDLIDDVMSELKTGMEHFSGPDGQHDRDVLVRALKRQAPDIATRNEIDSYAALFTEGVPRKTHDWALFDDLMLRTYDDWQHAEKKTPSSYLAQFAVTEHKQILARFIAVRDGDDLNRAGSINQKINAFIEGKGFPSNVPSTKKRRGRITAMVGTQTEVFKAMKGRDPDGLELESIIQSADDMVTYQSTTGFGTIETTTTGVRYKQTVRESILSMDPAVRVIATQHAIQQTGNSSPPDTVIEAYGIMMQRDLNDYIRSLPEGKRLGVLRKEQEKMNERAVRVQAGLNQFDSEMNEFLGLGE